MSLRLTSHFLESSHENEDDLDGRAQEDRSSSGEDEEEDGDLTWEDWVSDSASKRPCKSLFDDTTFTSVEDVLKHDNTAHEFDLDGTCSRLHLDLHQRLRLINWIRKEKPTPAQVNSFTGKEAFLKADEYLIPVIEDDPLLQTANGDDWSDEEDHGVPPKALEDVATATRRIQSLEAKLQQAQQDLKDYRVFVKDKLNLASLVEALQEPSTSGSDNTTAPLRDDDSHYFQSYGGNDIHAIMIQDKVRTATYASFILTNPDLFRDATVLDVGCGTGILSLFAARSGAKRVFAVDASDIAEKAERIVKDNGFEKVITVIRGKVEDIKLPDDVKYVDVIISEWMGYALLYESMLDSVLRARDRFLNPDTGVMAPSQCQMMFALCDAAEIFKERVGFWSDIYGFDLSAMAHDVHEDAIVDVVGPNTVASTPIVLKDLLLKSISARQLDFSAPFTLIANPGRKTKIHAFVLYFDTYFTVTGEPIPEGTEPHIVGEGDPMLAEVWQVGGKRHVSRRMSSGDPLKKPKPKISSFSTGPASVATHWKQTVFLLKEPFVAREGTTVQGTFKCKKSDGNSRELDVEIHYTVKDDGEDSKVSDVTVQIFKVR